MSKKKKKKKKIFEKFDGRWKFVAFCGGTLNL